MYPPCVWQADRRKQVKNLRGTAAVSALAQLVDESRSLGKTGKAELQPHIWSASRNTCMSRYTLRDGRRSSVISLGRCISAPADLGVQARVYTGAAEVFSAAFFALFSIVKSRAIV